MRGGGGGSLDLNFVRRGASKNLDDRSKSQPLRLPFIGIVYIYSRVTVKLCKRSFDPSLPAAVRCDG